MTAAEVYAAFGTTEEKEMDWLMNLVDTEIRQPQAMPKVKKIRPRADLPVMRIAASEVVETKTKTKTKKDKK